MRRFTTLLLAGSILTLIAILLPATAPASAALVSQPPEAVVGHTYSYQLLDSNYGIPTDVSPYGDYPGMGCSATGYASVLPIGLTLSTTGLITGTPSIPEQTKFCVALYFGDVGIDIVAVTMTVSSGNPSLDPIAISTGTQVAIDDATLTNDTANADGDLNGLLIGPLQCTEIAVDGLLGQTFSGSSPPGCPL